MGEVSSPIFFTQQAVEKGLYTALRFGSRMLTYHQVCSAARYSRALSLSLFEQPAKQGVFQHPVNFRKLNRTESAHNDSESNTLIAEDSQT